MAKNKKNDVDSFSGLFLGIEEPTETVKEPIKEIKEEFIKEEVKEPIKEIIEEPVKEKKEPIKESKPNNTKKSTPQDALIIIPQKEEVKSKRVNLLLKPSLHEKMQKKCKKLGISVNDCVNQLLEIWVNQE